jgi:drug/metabolite transporter (DMT)-like permease
MSWTAPEGGTADEATPHHPVLAALIVLAGLVLIGLTAATVRSLGSDPASGATSLATAVIWSLVPGVILAIGLRLALQTWARRTVGWGRLLAASIVLAALVIGAAALLTPSG